jgi:hypothetical protein
LPSRVAVAQVPTTSCAGQRSQELQAGLNRFSINVFQAPNGRILYAVTLDAAIQNDALVAFLEDGYYESFALQLAESTTTTAVEQVDALASPTCGIGSAGSPEAIAR